MDVANVCFVLLVFNDTFSTNRLYRVIGIWNIYCVGPGGHIGTYTNQTKEKYTQTLSSTWALCGGNLLTTLRCPQRGLSSQSLGKYWQLNQSNQHTHQHIAEYNNRQRILTTCNKLTTTSNNNRINQQDRRSRSLDLLTPRRSPSSALPLHTQKQCTTRGSSWVSSIPDSDHWRLLDPPWGEGRQDVANDSCLKTSIITRIMSYSAVMICIKMPIAPHARCTTFVYRAFTSGGPTARNS